MILLNKKEVSLLKQKGLVKTLLEKTGLQPLVECVYRRGEKLVIFEYDDNNKPIILISGRDNKFEFCGWCYPQQLQHKWFENGSNWLVPKWTLESMEMLPQKRSGVVKSRRSF